MTPRPPSSAVDECVETLRERILGGALAPGDRLPPERRLAEDLGVNRTTLRAALARLTDAHLLDVRQGSGYAVRDYRERGGPELIGGLVALATEPSAARDVIRDLLEVRRALAGAVLARLATGVSAEAAAGVRQAAEAFARAAESGADLETLATRDVDVLRALVDATNSPVFRLCVNPVATVLAELPKLRAAIYDDPRANAAAWVALASVLESPPDHRLDWSSVTSLLEARDHATLARLTPKEPSHAT